MANHEIDKEYSEELRKIETTDPVHADTLNPLYGQLINNDAFLKTEHDNLQQEFTAHKADFTQFKTNTNNTLVNKADQDGDYPQLRARATTKEDVGLGNVDNVKQMPISGGSFNGIVTAHNNTSYTVAQLRNVILSTSDPSGGNDGDIWIKYK